MKKQLFFLLFTVVTSFPLFAQFPGSTHSGNGWHLRGECEITMKNGEKIQFDGKIKNTEIEGSGIDYKDVDFITLVKTFYTGAFQRFNGTVYRYVNIKDKPCLLQIRAEYPRCSFYTNRPHSGTGSQTGLEMLEDLFMIKDGAKSAVKVQLGANYKNIKTLFPDCPRLIQYQKDKTMRGRLSYRGIAYLYSNSCTEAMTEDEKLRDFEILGNLVNQK